MCWFDDRLKNNQDMQVYKSKQHQNIKVAIIIICDDTNDSSNLCWKIWKAWMDMSKHSDLEYHIYINDSTYQHQSSYFQFIDTSNYSSKLLQMLFALSCLLSQEEHRYDKFILCSGISLQVVVYLDCLSQQICVWLSLCLTIWPLYTSIMCLAFIVSLLFDYLSMRTSNYITLFMQAIQSHNLSVVRHFYSYNDSNWAFFHIIIKKSFKIRYHSKFKGISCDFLSWMF